VKNILIGGIGNVLLGDDAVGPYVIHLLECSYRFDHSVEIADLGTPALDLTHRIAGRDAVILVDCIASKDYEPGTVLLIRKDDLLRAMPLQRLDPHSPALAECLMTANMLGAAPEQMLLVGIVAQSYEPGHPLSETVRGAARKAIDAILEELQPLGVEFKENPSPGEPSTWWSNDLELCSRTDC